MPNNKLIASLLICCFFPCCIRHPTGPIYISAPIVINEFMAINKTDTILDEYGRSSDWIELHNVADTSFCLWKLFVSDDSSELLKYPLPDTVIPSKGYFILWADGEPDKGRNHTNFKLSAFKGEEILICTEQKVIVDRINYRNIIDARIPDVSYGRYPDGSSPGEGSNPHRPAKPMQESIKLSSAGRYVTH